MERERYREKEREREAGMMEEMFGGNEGEREIWIKR